MTPLKDRTQAILDQQRKDRYTPPPDFTKTGWLSPNGEYYPTQGWGYLHEELAQLICLDNEWEFEAVYGGTTAQWHLVWNGYIRFDHTNIDFARRPTQLQIEAIRKMYQWKIDNPTADDYRDYTCWQCIGQFLQWADGDPNLWHEDAETFDDKLKRRQDSQ